LKNQIYCGRKYIIVIVAEATKKTQDIIQWLENNIGIETRATILGHLQRGGSPSSYDRLMAIEFITKAIDKLLSNKFNVII